MMWRLFFLLLVLSGTLVKAQPVLPVDVPLRLEAMRVVLMVNNNGTVTLIYDWEYDMYPPQAVMSIWFIPVPSEPTIELLPHGMLDTLSTSTMKHFRLPDNPCPYTGDSGYPGFDYRAVNITEAQYVRGERMMERIEDWLAKGFWVDTKRVSNIQAYIDAGMDFVALTVPLYGNEQGLISPVKLTYRAESPIVYTLYHTAYAQVWIFASSQYAPANYPHPTLDFTALHSTSEAEANLYPWNYIELRLTTAAYDRALKRLTEQHNDFFVTEYATPTESLITYQDDLLIELVSHFRYMTSLRANLGVSDPIFVAMPDLPDIARDVDLSDVDPHAFWICEGS